MKIKMTALELILHLADGSTTPNTLKHIAKIAKTTLEEMKAREEMQPFEDMTDPAYFRGFAHGKAEAQRKPLTDEQILTVFRDHYNPYQRPEISFARAIEAAHGIKE